MNAILKFFRNEIDAWPAWWRKLPGHHKTIPPVLIAIYWIALYLLDGLRSDHIVVGVTMLLLAYGGKTARVALAFLMPAFLTGIVYDSQRHYSDYIRGEIRVKFPYEFDLRFFGVDTPEGRLTPNEWWQKHTYPLLDLVTGFFYLFFIAIYVAICAWHRFIVPIRATDPVIRNRAEKIGPLSTWAFFWVNCLGYSTYYWFPAAPPWYVSDHGLAEPANLAVQASPAGAARFDELLGTTFFTGMYGRSADVFGAIPSLHVAYPFLAMLFAFQLKSWRTFSTFFYLIMCFSAVYLNHHYILDLIWGSAYALFIWWCVNLYAGRKRTLELADSAVLGK